MIRNITFKNFYSFEQEQVMNFVTIKKKSDDYYKTFDNKQVSKLAGFAGSNASGKTNAMRIFGFLAYMMTADSRPSGDNFIPYKAYSFTPNKESSLTVEFETLEYLMVYSLVMKGRVVVSEEIQFKDLKKNSRYTKLFKRLNEKITLNTKILKGVTEKKLSSIPVDVSLVAFINANYDISIIKDVFTYFAGFDININEEGETEDPVRELSDALNYYLKYPSIKKRMEEIIRDFNIGINDFKFTKLEEDGTYFVEANHLVKNKVHSLSLTYESKGTRALFHQLARILRYLEKGTVLIWDEIESGLHPEAVEKIIQFISEELAVQKKQFIFSSHSLEFMKKFDAQQIFLVDKKENSSSLFRLDQLNVRPDDNYYSKYLSGAYGAFPKIRI